MCIEEAARADPTKAFDADTIPFTENAHSVDLPVFSQTHFCALDKK
jgi:hypothetical protein